MASKDAMAQFGREESERSGLVVKIVGGQSVTGLSYEQVTAIIGSHEERPLHMVFMSVGIAASPRSSPRPKS